MSDYYIQVTTISTNKMNTTVTCTFQVPEDENQVVIELQGQKIRFSNIMDPENAYLHTSYTPTGNEEGHVGDMVITPLNVRQCKAALVHYYKNKVLPQIDHPDKESDNFFYTWMLGALPVKIPEWNKEAWQRAFGQE